MDAAWEARHLDQRIDQMRRWRCGGARDCPAHPLSLVGTVHRHSWARCIITLLRSHRGCSLLDLNPDPFAPLAVEWCDPVPNDLDISLPLRLEQFQIPSIVWISDLCTPITAKDHG